MKLFGRVLLFFLGVIVLQSLLIFLLVTNIVEVENVEDARDEILIESEAAFDAFHDIKQRLWESLLRIRASRIFTEFLNEPSEFHGGVNDLVDSGAVDWLVLKNADDSVRVLNQNYAAFPFEAYPMLHSRHEYPHGGFVRWNDDIYFMATFRSVKSPEGSVEVYLIKHLSADFLRSLTRRMDGFLFLFAGSEMVTRTAVRFEADRLAAPVYTDEIRYNVDTGEDSLNVAFSRIGEMGSEQLFIPLSLGFGLSSTLYEDRLWMVRKVLFWVAVGSTVMAGFLSLLFSRNISKPVAILLDAMKRFRKGEPHAGLPETSISEFRDLFSQFKRMVQTLESDRTEMERYIDEITGLKEFNETIIDSLYSGMVLLDEACSIIRVNRAFLELFDIDGGAPVGSSLRSLLPDFLDRELENGIRDVVLRQVPILSTVRRLPGFRVFDVKAYPLSRVSSGNREIAVLVVDDISKRIEAEEKIYQAEKLSSISLLTAGVAHEINNPLTSILSNVQMLIEDEKDEEKRDALVWMEQETRRIARIVRNLLEFSGSEKGELQCEDAKGVLETVIHLLSFSVAGADRIRIVKELSPVPPVAVSSDELKQIAINIMKNSIQALDGGGTLTISMGAVPSPDSSGAEVLIRFADTGCGMQESDLSRVYDPFFTTKGGGDGTGLGLSLVYGLIEKHQGSITISSSPGEGTEVYVRLPLAGEGTEDEAKQGVER